MSTYRKITVRHGLAGASHIDRCAACLRDSTRTWTLAWGDTASCWRPWHMIRAGKAQS